MRLVYFFRQVCLKKNHVYIESAVNLLHPRQAMPESHLKTHGMSAAATYFNATTVHSLPPHNIVAGKTETRAHVLQFVLKQRSKDTR